MISQLNTLLERVQYSFAWMFWGFPWTKTRLKKHFDCLWLTDKGLDRLESIQKTPLLLALYHYSQGSFFMEQSGTLSGLVSYHRQNMENKSSLVSYALRRNIHRIEKGLSTPQSRSVFAEKYIWETACELERALENQVYDDSLDRRVSDDTTVQWGVDVLGKYFETVNSTEEIQRSKQRFQAVLQKHNLSEGSMYPYRRGTSTKPQFDYDGLLELSLQRRSVRWYKARPVPRDLIDAAIKVAKLAPSACNRQAFEFRIFDDPKLVRKIADLPWGESDFTKQVPCIVVLVGKLRAYFHDRDRHIIYIDASLAAMSFLYGLETLGLSSCCLNWPNLQEKEMAIAKLLGLAADERVVMSISVGYPKEDVKVCYSRKKSLDELRSYNRT